VLTLVAASLLSWLTLADSSPFRDYFLYHVTIPNAWGSLNIVPGLLSFIVGGHAGSEVVFLLAFAVQWLFIGLVLGLLLASFLKR
jgi:hypothetical protein